jgi:GR25 family glycosyltransferase involved in LPS biosynthesis
MMKAFVISLPRAPERRAAITAMLSGVIAFEIVDAVDGQQLSGGRELQFCRDRYCARAFRDLSLTEIACSASHRKALEQFLHSGAETGLILEDDAEIAADAFARLSLLAPHLAAFDLVKLGGGGHRLAPGRVALSAGGVSVVAVVAPTVGAYAYVVSRSGARKLVRTVLPVREPFDTFLRNVHVHRCAVFETSPRLARESEHGVRSTIGGSRVPLRHSPSLRKSVRSAAFRLHYNVMRRLFNLRRFGLAYITRAGLMRLPG